MHTGHHDRLTATTGGVRPPSGDGGRVDLEAKSHRLYIEVKRRVGGSAGGAEPSSENLAQIDGYLASNADPATLGVLTDGKYWFIRTASGGSDRVPGKPFRHVFDSENGWLLLFEWLRDEVFANRPQRKATPDAVRADFAPGTVGYTTEVGAIRSLYETNKTMETVKIKRALWEELLSIALGEIAGIDLDDLFVRHTYLVAVIGMITQASFLEGGAADIKHLAANNPKDLLRGNTFREATHLVDIVESDFFSWLTEVDHGDETIRRIADHVASFEWGTDGADATLPSVLYETVIPPSERQKLGEYYTPAWLAEAVVKTAVSDPLSEKVLDPACGSGSFLVAVIKRIIEAASEAGLNEADTLARLQEQVCGIDIHPVAVHLARASWVMAAKEVITAERVPADVSVPVYLGDSLQLLHKPDSFFGQETISVPATGDPQNRELAFPVSLVKQPRLFGPLMTRIAADLAQGDSPSRVTAEYSEHMDDNETAAMQEVAQKLVALHAEGLNHIWAYFVRNLVRPIVIAEQKVDVVIGNPPWLTYNKTKHGLREALDSLGNDYGIKPSAKYMTHFDIAALFVVCCADLYLRPPDEERQGGRLSMVLPHSALISGQYEQWRTGKWSSSAKAAIAADFSVDKPWDLENLEPNDFFPVPASVVHLCRARVGESVAMLPNAQQWSGSPDKPTNKAVALPRLVGAGSPYEMSARQGATIVPRSLFFVTQTDPPSPYAAKGFAHTKPRRGSKDKAPWKHLDLAELSTPGTVENTHLIDVHLGETIAPYATMSPRQAVLPIDKDNPYSIAKNPDTGDVRFTSLPRQTQNRWKTMCALWDDHKGARDNKTLLEQLDYLHKLQSQLQWHERRHGSDSSTEIRLVYSSSGRPTASILPNPLAQQPPAPLVVVDSTLYWLPCPTLQEAQYLLAIINSDILYERVKPLMPKGQFGPRHLQKHLWKLPIPKYDPNDADHVSVRNAGAAAAKGAQIQLAEFRLDDRSTRIAAIRKHIRTWLKTSPQGIAVEQAVNVLLD